LQNDDFLLKSVFQILAFLDLIRDDVLLDLSIILMATASLVLS
jgi:hypothetical protein